MSEPEKKLLLVIPIKTQDDLIPVVESEGWHTVKDLFKKTGTSFNLDWNGKYVVDQDEIPWKVSDEDLASLHQSSGLVVVLSGVKYSVTEEVKLFGDTDGSVYVLEKDLEGFFL